MQNLSHASHLKGRIRLLRVSIYVDPLIHTYVHVHLSVYRQYLKWLGKPGVPPSRDNQEGHKILRHFENYKPTRIHTKLHVKMLVRCKRCWKCPAVGDSCRVTYIKETLRRFKCSWLPQKKSTGQPILKQQWRLQWSTMQSGRQKVMREHPQNICMPLVLIEDGLPMHITTQRNQIISWLVRKVQPEKFCYVASCSVGALQQEKKKLKNVRHALKTCVKFQRHLNLSLNWVAKRLATHYFREQRPSLDDTTYVQHMRNS